MAPIRPIKLQLVAPATQRCHRISKVQEKYTENIMLFRKSKSHVLITNIYRLV